MNPFPYQIECVNEIDWFGGRALVAAEPGLGKTLISLEWLRRHPEARPVVVVCPASVKWVWELEAARHRMQATVLEGRIPNGDAIEGIAVVNYDVLKDWLPTLKKMGPRTVVIDESHFAANGRAKRTRAVKALCRGTPHVLALSGTPLVNRPIELYEILHTLQPWAFPSKFRYAQEFCDPRWTPWGWKYDGATNSAGLHKLLNSLCMVRRKKEDVLKDLPPKIRDVVPVQLSDPAEYARARDDFLDWLRSKDAKAAERASRAEAVTRIGHLLRLTARLKMPAVIGWVNDWLEATDEKLVVFAKHRESVASLLKGCRAKSVFIDGSVPSGDRRRAVTHFQKDPRVRLLIGNIRAAGVGITLTASRTVAFAELDWRPGDHTQAEDRCHRIGTRDTVWCHYLVAKGTIEDVLCRVLRDKQQVLDAVVDGADAGEESIFDSLVNSLREK